MFPHYHHVHLIRLGDQPIDWVSPILLPWIFTAFRGGMPPYSLAKLGPWPIMIAYEFNTFFPVRNIQFYLHYDLSQKGKQIQRVSSMSWKKLPCLMVLSTNTPNQFLTYRIDSFLHPRYTYKRLQEVCKGFNDFLNITLSWCQTNIKYIKLTAKHCFLPTSPQNERMSLEKCWLEDQLCEVVPFLVTSVHFPGCNATF